MSIIDNFLCLKVISDLRRNQYSKREELLKIQEKNLRIILDHAFHNVQLYNSKFRLKGIKPNEIKKIKDLTKIPLTTKQEIKNGMQKNLRYVLDRNSNLNQCRISYTSGTTGIPLRIYKSKKDLYHNWARQAFVFFECGVKLRDKIIRILVPKIKKEYWLQKCGLLRIEDISIKQPIHNIINKLSKSKFDVLQSYPTIYLLLAEYIKNYDINPRIIFSAAETLNEISRKKIKSVFNTELFELYGAYEFGRIAFECEQHCGMHAISDHYIIEVLRDGENVSPGEKGEIVITGLHNYMMPFIRYRIGDIGMLSDEVCSCGRNYSLIKGIESRIDDFLELPSGRIISPRNINIDEYIEGVIEFQIIQKRRDKFLVKLVKGNGFSNDVIPKIEEMIKTGCLDEEVNVEIKVVDRIERGETGKLKNIISNT
jgi:phenylacetate-CoA ligase